MALMLAASCEQQPSASPACQDMGRWKILERNYTLHELETFGLAHARRNPRIPQVPFAHGYEQWRKLRAMYRPGDAIRAFDNPEISDDKRFGIPDGLVLKRGECVIFFMGLRQ